MFKNRVLRRIFGPKKDGVMGEWRRLHNEELNYLYSSPDIIWVIKSRRMIWMGHVACRGGEERCILGVGGNVKGKDYLEDPGIDGRLTLEWILRKWYGWSWTGLIWLIIGMGVYPCKYSNELLGNLLTN